MRSDQPRRAAIVGAGAAGLCAARHLLARGIEPTIFEAGSKVGGLWVYDNDNGASVAYRSLHVNSETLITAYKDFPFPPDSPQFPDHAGMASYLESYADHFDLRRHIRFSSRVTSVAKAGSGWQVTVDGGPVEVFDCVVVASGHQAAPRHPAFRHDFAGEYLHSKDYRTPEPFRDRSVVVVGMGNSGCDIAADVCTAARVTVIAARSPVLLMPRIFFGQPTSRFLAKLEKSWMPWPVRRRIREFVARVAHGRMEQWGFVTPQTRTHPTSHPLLISQMLWGRVRGKPGIDRIDGKVVTFADGTREEFDVMIAATGFHVDLPFLPAELSPVEGKWLNLYHRVVMPGAPGLYFIGFFNVTGGGNIRMMDDQAEWMCAIEAGETRLPAEAQMREAILRERARIERDYPGTDRYGLELEPGPYRRALGKEFAAGRKRAANARS